MRLSTLIAALLGAAQPIWAGAVCSQEPYAALLFLSAYAPAEQFCSQHYPQPAVTVTANARRLKRDGAKRSVCSNKSGSSSKTTKSSAQPTTRTTSKSSSASTTASVNTCTGACASFKSCTEIGGGFLSTLCSCLEHPSTVVSCLCSHPSFSTLQHFGNLITGCLDCTSNYDYQIDYDTIDHSKYDSHHDSQYYS